MNVDRKYRDFRSFYAHYLNEHSNEKNRLLHFLGTLFFMVLVLAGFVMGKWWLFFLIPIVGYGFAWVGHFFVEKNKPATFSQPVFSLAADFVMFWHIITGQIHSKLEQAKNKN
jgi:hypothetical protein